MKRIFLIVALAWALTGAVLLTAGDAPGPDSQKRPKILKRVNPAYPEEAARQGIEGVVVIEATCDERGDVVNARVLPSDMAQPLLEAAALAAVRQWKYKPYLVKGKPMKVNFIVTMNFALKKNKEGGLPPGTSQRRPKILTRVNPVYPAEAARQGIEGVVVIEATCDERGDVVGARVMPSDTALPLLEEAALTAVRQWKYEPYLVKGKPMKVNFTVTLNFALSKGKDNKQEK